MANYQNGQPYYGSHNHPARGPQDAYGAQASYNDPNHRRPTSFDAGDDPQGYDQGQEQSNWQSGYSGYSTGSYAARTHPMSIQTSIPYRSNTQTAALSGYQHYQPQTPSQYNPAQYQHQPQQQPQYTPQSYQTPQTAFPTNSSYQPYVPAAYQGPSGVNRQASMYNTNNYYNQTPQTAFQNPQPPPLPHRSSEYGGQQASSFGGYQHEPQYPVQSHYSSAGSVPTQQSLLSNNAPPPPPHDTPASTRPYSHASSTNNRSSMSSVGAHQASEINRNSSYASRMSTQSSSFSPSPQPSIPTPPSRNLSDRSPQRSNTLDRHPQGRSLPGVPSESESETDYFVPSESRHQSNQHSRTSGFDDLMQDINSAIDRRSSQGIRTSGGGSPQPILSPDEAPTHLNGIASTGETYINYGAFSDDSDAEAAAGLAAMQALDEQEKAEDARRRSGSATLFPSQPQNESDLRPHSSQDLSSDSDYTGYDLSAAGGGYAPDLSYGDGMPISNYAAAAATMPQSELYDRLNPRMSSVRSSGMSSEGRDSQASGFDDFHPLPPIRNVARVDTGGTGGLTEPSPHPRRLSYEDGDEGHFEWDEGRTPESGSPSRDGMQDLFFHPGMSQQSQQSQQRPLPPPPSNSDPGTRLSQINTTGTYTQQTRFSQYTDNRSSYYPVAPDAYGSNTLLSPTAVPRSTSLTSQRNKPQVEQPMRSKTDADRAKFLRQQQLSERPLSDIYDPSEPSSAIPLDLPAIPRKRFNPSKLTNDQFKNCPDPWALSSVLSWIKDLADEENDLRESAITDGIVALFLNKVPTMNTTEAESLAHWSPRPCLLPTHSSRRKNGSGLVQVACLAYCFSSLGLDATHRNYTLMNPVAAAIRITACAH